MTRGTLTSIARPNQVSSGPVATLIVSTAKGKERVPLGPLTQVGRSPECDVVLNDASISRRHAVIRQADGIFNLTDEQSRFGTFVNSEKVETALLRHGDEVKFGNIVALFEDEAQHVGVIKLSDPTELKRVIAELETRVQELQLATRKSQALLALHESFSRCTSASMVLQGAGPFLVRALRADRCALMLFDSEAKRLLPAYYHQLTEVPPSRMVLLKSSFDSGAMKTGAVGADARLPLAAPLPGADGRVEGMVYLELAPGRPFTADDAELLAAMRAQVGAAMSQLSLVHKMRREEQLRVNLSRYVSDQVADAVLSGRLNVNLGGEQRRVTVLFVDVRGFTSLSEKLPPEHVLALLNDYFGQTVPVIKAAQGTVDKFIGDAMMAVFGAPNDLPDQEVRAVRAANLIQQKVHALRDLWKTRPWADKMDVSQFSVGIGINTGFAVAGNLGTDDRKEFAVIGDAVNVASRLCSQAKPGEVIIGADTAKAVASMFKLKALGEITVKGRQQPVAAFHVSG